MINKIELQFVNKNLFDIFNFFSSIVSRELNMSEQIEFNKHEAKLIEEFKELTSDSIIQIDTTLELKEEFEFLLTEFSMYNKIIRIINSNTHNSIKSKNDCITLLMYNCLESIFNNCNEIMFVIINDSNCCMSSSANTDIRLNKSNEFTIYSSGQNWRDQGESTIEFDNLINYMFNTRKSINKQQKQLEYN